MNTSIKQTLLTLAIVLCVANAFAPMGITTKRSAISMRRGRGSGLKKELNDDSPRSPSSSSSSFTGGMGKSPSGTSWLDTKKSVKELPTEDGEIKLIETGAFLLVNKQTNPGGAAATAKYGGEMFCFDANCPQCKVPLSKSKILPPNDETKNKAPRIACDLCKYTYNIKTGEQLEAEESTGFLGGIAKSILGSQEGGDLPTYQLGEKNGRIMFTMEGM
mmetsp:Transcript_22023/g.52417  ORF Transcript_22023/g.52417 Transcript_22023/m.52417 type:complete len:218 (-) Transcript_22023:118-771(-)|eukprot:CAMPEP_0197183964 /NCGR_PEP_ID=MMETSP1423-20130617/8885_1 /TAXON_ID=476441 /ORGANISM="Pseudo-nitzschia heimii, Strain UNC1101" /LENGTH=217 /DNA_ID=CAMNT_0042634653 /DNA_START=155 /DNA_END=808 /DNA_ORIENTATION=+